MKDQTKIKKVFKKDRDRIERIERAVRHLLKCCGSSSGTIQSITGGNNISIDNTDPFNPIISAINIPADISELTDLSNLLFSGSYMDLSDVPTTFPPSAHNHDDRYYTEAEVDTFLKTEIIRAYITPYEEDIEDDTNYPYYIATENCTITASSVVFTIWVPSQGADVIVHLKKNGSIITTTPITIPENTNVSVSPPVLSDNVLQKGDILTVYIPVGGVGTVDAGQSIMGKIEIQK